MHIGVSHLIVRDSVDKLSLRVDLNPVGVQEGHSLLSEGKSRNLVEESERFSIKLLSEGLVHLGTLLVELSSISGRHGGGGVCALRR